jgi:hypothetical protein
MFRHPPCSVLLRQSCLYFNRQRRRLTSTCYGNHIKSIEFVCGFAPTLRVERLGYPYEAIAGEWYRNVKSNSRVAVYPDWVVSEKPLPNAPLLSVLAIADCVSISAAIANAQNQSCGGETIRLLCPLGIARSL